MNFRIDTISTNENQNIIEVVSGDSALGCLRQSDLKNNLIFYLPIQLSFGDLKSLENYDRSCLKELYYTYKDYSPFNEGYVFRKEREELKKYISKAEKIRVWSSHKDVNEFLLLLYICYLFPDKNISVIFVDEYNPNCWSIGCIDFREVNKLAEKEHLLALNEKESYISEWKRIVKENSPLRYIENGNIKSIPINYFDEAILFYLGNREISFMSLVAMLMANDMIDNNSDSVYIYLINCLIEQGKIEVVRVDENNKKIIRATANN